MLLVTTKQELTPEKAPKQIYAEATIHCQNLHLCYCWIEQCLIFPLILPGMANQGFDTGEAIVGQGMDSIQRVASGVQDSVNEVAKGVLGGINAAHNEAMDTFQDAILGECN